MKVIHVLGDKSGCAHYRMILPGNLARENGVEIEVVDSLPGKGTIENGEFVPKFVNVDAIEADVIVLQRPVHDLIVDAIPKMQEKGIAVVAEIDDDMHTLDPENQAYIACHPKYSPRANWNHLARACRQADLVTVSTEALSHTRYCSHGRFRIVPNSVPKRLLEIRTEKDPVVGWSGVINTHPRDLQVTQGGVAQSLEGTDYGFRVVGQAHGVGRALGLPEDPEDTGWLPIDQYYEELSKLSIGIVPLADTAFNRSKSNLKGLEYAALGVPFVASPLPEYEDLEWLGAGLLAHKRKAWKSKISSLIDQDNQTFIDAGREVVEKHYLLEDNWEKWVNAWCDAIAIRKGKK